MNAVTSSPLLFQAGSESQQPKEAGAHARRQTLFGKPLLLEDEDGAAYDELLGRIWATVKPADTLDEMFTIDVVSLEWEVLRWRRLKLRLIRECTIKALDPFLYKELGYGFYSEYFAGDLAEILQDNLPAAQANFVQTLAHQYARSEEDAVDKVNKILQGTGWVMKDVLDRARYRRVKELVKQYARRESDAVALIDELLTGAGKNIDALIAEALVENLDYVERIDRLTAIAESRRNASLREIDRRRAVLAATLRQSVQQIEHDELEVIEAPPVREESAT